MGVVDMFPHSLYDNSVLQNEFPWAEFILPHTHPADLLLPDDYSDYTRVHDMNDLLLLPANDIMWANVYETNLHKVFYPIV